MYWKRLPYVVSLLLLVNISFAAQTAKPAPKPAAPKPTAATSDTIRAKKIELTDDSGTVRAWIGLTDTGDSAIRLYDKNGKPTVVVGSDGVISVLDDKQKPKVTVGKMGELYGVGILDDNNSVRASMTLSFGDPKVILLDAEGKASCELGMVANAPCLSLYDGQEKGASMTLAVGRSLPSITMWDKNGKERSFYGIKDNGWLSIDFNDPNEMPCLGLAALDSTAQITIGNPISDVSAYFGSPSADEVGISLMQNGKNLASMFIGKPNSPYVRVMYPNGKPAAMLGIDDNNLGFARTANTNDGTLWRSP